MNWLASAGKERKRRGSLNGNQVTVVQARSAFREFAKQFSFSVDQSSDPSEFLRIISQEALRVLDENKGKRVKSVLRCEMTRTDMILGKELTEEAAFHSEVETNLQGDDSRELFIE